MSPHDDPNHGLPSGAKERLIGLALIVGGVVGFGVIFVMWQYAPASMPAPPGLPRNLLPLTSPLNCMLPISVIGSSLLVLMGLKKLVFGE
jgi:hypothetical protein